ncbi:hypothetical protein OY671_007186 [Metschnikowia pulcherrima]|nr:hypothetical protein OY671_007186 [Metschnikowia pulcherrima]
MGAVIMRSPSARHRGSSRSRSPSPQAVLAQGNDPHGGSEIAARISRSSAGGKAVPAAAPPQRQSAGPWLTRSRLPAPRTTPADSRCPPLSPAFLGVRVPADGMAIAGQAI